MTQLKGRGRMSRATCDVPSLYLCSACSLLHSVLVGYNSGQMLANEADYGKDEYRNLPVYL